MGGRDHLTLGPGWGALGWQWGNSDGEAGLQAPPGTPGLAPGACEDDASEAVTCGCPGSLPGDGSLGARHGHGDKHLSTRPLLGPAHDSPQVRQRT